MAITLIEEACEAGARFAPACEVLELDPSTVHRWRAQRAHDALGDGRKAAAQGRTPPNKLSCEQRQCIVDSCNAPEHASLPPSQIVPKLADEGIYYASEATFYRVLREEEQVNPRGKAQAPRRVAKPKGYVANAPRQVFSWDITYLPSVVRGSFYRLYLVEDVFSRMIVGWEVHHEETAAHASQLIQKICLAEGIVEPGLVLHADNGGPMKGATMLATLQRLGIVASFSRPSVSDDNPYSESLFRTLKYHPTYPAKPFESLEAAREWVGGFVDWYNNEHRHSAIRYVTPAQRHRGKDVDILTKRHELYQRAKEANPERWSGKTRNWQPIEEVWLNPPKEKENKNPGSVLEAQRMAA